MNIRCDQRPAAVRYADGWRRRFALVPRRVSKTHVCWLGLYWSRWITTVEGNWAGGDRGYEERAPLDYVAPHHEPRSGAWRSEEREG